MASATSLETIAEPRSETQVLIMARATRVHARVRVLARAPGSHGTPGLPGAGPVPRIASAGVGVPSYLPITRARAAMLGDISPTGSHCSDAFGGGRATS